MVARPIRDPCEGFARGPRARCQAPRVRAPPLAPLLAPTRYLPTWFFPILLATALWPFTATAADAPVGLDSGNTAWVLASTALVLFMTIPGLALFYGGLVRQKNVLSVLMQCLALTALLSLVWLVRRLLAGVRHDGDGGGPGRADGLHRRARTRDARGRRRRTRSSDRFPRCCSSAFQCTFAVITPALILGAFAERMRFSAVLLFSALWLVVVYAPICHMTWGGAGRPFRGPGRIRFRRRHRRPHHRRRRRAGRLHRDRTRAMATRRPPCRRTT